MVSPYMAVNRYIVTFLPKEMVLATIFLILKKFGSNGPYKHTATGRIVNKPLGFMVSFPNSRLSTLSSRHPKHEMTEAWSCTCPKLKSGFRSKLSCTSAQNLHRTLYSLTQKAKSNSICSSNF